METLYLAILVGTLLVLMAAFSSLLAFRFGTPLLLLFLCIGLVAGTDGFGVQFDNGQLAYFVGSLALAVILFDSGFGTSLHAFRQAAAPAITMATLGVLLTAGIFGLMACVVFDLQLIQGLLLGSIVASTDAAAVFFLLRIGGIAVRDRVRSTLEVESGSNDPMAIFLTIALVQIATGTDGSSLPGIDILRLFGMQMGLGVAIGLPGGMLIVWLVNKLDMERGLTPIFVVTLALLVFSATGALGGSGFLAVYIAGLYAGNRSIRAKTAIRRFQEGMTWLAQIVMFLVLGLLATPSQFPAIALPAIALALFLVLVARPVAVWLCLSPFRYTKRERLFISWVGLRGAVSILLAILPVIGGVEGGMLFFNTAFIIVLVSLLLQGWTISPMAKRLSLVVPPRIGPVQRVEVELPGSANHELVAYRVVKDSPVLTGERIPRWARPSLVVRNGRSMRYQYAGRLQENDHVYLFISPNFPRLLDRLFASPAPVEKDDTEFFGAFTVDPKRTLGELDEAYGPGIVPANSRETTLAEYLERRFGGRAEYADRLRLGPLEIIVRDVDDRGEITSLGVSLEPEPLARPLPDFINRKTARSALDRLARRRRNRRKAEDRQAAE
ncbi:potassium/proton antiporter [Pararhizobium mangrovi]|uniref:Potassium/proton antiporter n=1 Tax=Pararhizobium mangrovi TaxID=2590452 RepID=A0A506U3M7_9HYPH|nr:potassium/proton antiporter [Pararhizobium mangrovi]TPW27615.1 potassium/proton antiporter [Pararhizobium mangrovi]